MEEWNNYFEPQRPLVLLKQDQQFRSNLRCCRRCGEEVVSDPWFVSAEVCWISNLHKVCADAPLELNHPFHSNHPLVMKRLPYQKHTHLHCKICDEGDARWMYHCSCDFYFHIRCAVSTFNMAQNNFKELDLVIPNENEDGEGEDVAKCFGCWEPLANYPYFSLDSGFNLHKKCAELPLKLNHRCHRKHPLTLQFNTDRFLCAICQIDEPKGIFYGCSPCDLFIHIKCLSPPRNIESKTHPHPFTLFWRQGSVICDACGTQGNHVMYTCGTCDIIVHKECISLPRFIKSKWHDHRLAHTYFFHREYMGILDCVICHEEVNTEHGSYSCSKCNDIFHVNCVTKDEDSYVIVEDEKEEPVENSFIVLEWNDAGEAIVVQHFKHIHSLRLSDKVSEHENKCCDGCLLSISASFYFCSECEFYLHKTCAELPKVKHVWHHRCKQPLVLTSNEIFECVKCDHTSNSFSYKCEECDDYTCFRCVVALTPGARTCLAHKHNPLLFYTDYEGKCSACGKGDTKGMFRCKDCDICLDVKCFSLPMSIQHKCDGHLLSLIEHDDNNYSKSHFCDICEESRDLNLWFYHCVRCTTSAHVKCVLGEYPFIKLRSIFQDEYEDEHEHPLTFIKRVYYYPNCSECGEPCLDFAFECIEPGCHFVHHVDSCP